MRRAGLVAPPIEVKAVRDYYLIVEGHHRVEAARAEGRSEIAAIISS
jgi:ParB-like chromosome segregation protein Spo0J